MSSRHSAYVVPLKSDVYSSPSDRPCFELAAQRRKHTRMMICLALCLGRFLLADRMQCFRADVLGYTPCPEKKVPLDFFPSYG